MCITIHNLSLKRGHNQLLNKGENAWSFNAVKKTFARCLAILTTTTSLLIVQVKAAVVRGDREEAVKHSRLALMWSVCAMIAGTVSAAITAGVVVGTLQ